MLFFAREIREETMIHHLSIAARDPKHVAGVLAEVMGGKAVPFPPNPGSFFALQLDEHGSGVEVYPAGTELHPGAAMAGGSSKKRLAVLARRISRSASLPTPIRSKPSPSAKAGTVSTATAARFM